jgi:chromosome segregation ATPase
LIFQNEYEAAILQSTQEKKKIEESLKQSSLEVEELKYLLRQQQQEREAEQTDHVAMLRELQQLVAKERQSKDDLESQVQDLEEALSRVKESPEKLEVYERRLKAVTDELHETRRKLKAADKSADRPSPILLQLQKEMAELKAQHAQALLVEQQRANDAEQRLKAARGVIIIHYHIKMKY